MAKKRTGSKDTGPENTGTGEEKGKGIDLLFGGAPVDEGQSDDETIIEGSSQASAPPPPSFEERADASTGAFSAPPPPPPVPDAVPIESLPTNEADDEEEAVASSERMVDEFGLPVAMETPPADLELAAPAPAPPNVAETSAGDLDLSLPPSAFQVATPPAKETPSQGNEADAPSLDLSEADLAAPAGDDLSGSVPGGVSDAGELDLNLEDFGDAPPTAPPATPAQPAAPFSPAPPETSPPSSMTPTAPPLQPVTPSPQSPPPSQPVTPSPLPTSPSQPGIPSSRPPTPPSQPVTPSPRPPTPSSSPPPPTTSPPTPSPAPTTPPPPPTPSIAPPRARIDSIGGIASEKIQVVEKDILPDDTKYSGGPVTGVLAVSERGDVERDELVSQKVTRYIGRERRENLDKEIEKLYDDVAKELSVNKTDTEFALRTLSQAQDIIFEDARQYDEALYRVAIVRTMITRKQNLRRWSYTWGSAVFFYAVIWLAAFVSGFLLRDIISAYIGESSSSAVTAVRNAWFSALAGGVGGVIGILYSLYWHVAMKQDFDRQYVMYYVVQPVMGFVLGALIYFLVIAGFLVVNFSTDPSAASTANVLESTTIFALQIILGFIAGFRQRFVFEMIDKIVQRLSPREEGDETNEPVSVVPDQLGSPRPPTGRR